MYKGVSRLAEGVPAIWMEEYTDAIQIEDVFKG